MVEYFTQAGWYNLWERLGAGCPTGSFSELAARYREPHRAHHTAAHIEALLRAFWENRELAQFPDRVELALWLHDVVYDVPGPHNEALSAALALRWLTEAGLVVHGPDVVSAILATTHDACASNAPDAALVADLDLSVLAGDEGAYDAYAHAIRQEYGVYGDAVYNLGRRCLLERLLALPSIYATPALHQRWELRARANLHRELAQLRNSAPVRG